MQRDHHREPDVKVEKTTQQCAIQEKNVRGKNVTPPFLPHSHEKNHGGVQMPSTQETKKAIAGSGTLSFLQKHDEYTNAHCSKDKEEDKSKFQSLHATIHLPDNGLEKDSEVWNDEELVTVDVLGQCVSIYSLTGMHIFKTLSLSSDLNHVCPHDTNA